MGVPAGVQQVVVRDFLVDFAALFGVYLFDVLGRSAGPQFVRTYLGIGQDYGAGGNDSALAYHGVVHDHGAHAYQGEVVYVRPVYSDVMADGNIVADGDGGFAEKRVQYAAILNIDAVADGDGIDIAAQDGAKPYAAFFAHGDISYNGGVFGQKSVCAYHRSVSAQWND